MKQSTLVSLTLPALASASGSLPPLERNARHRDLAWKVEQRQTSTSGVPLGGFQVVGQSGVSAQMMFLGTENTVYILDSESQ